MNNENIKIIFTGDFAPRLRVTETINQGNYTSLFGDFLDDIRNADIAITNLESPLCETYTPITKTGPNLIAPVKSIDALKYAGFTLVTLANNHIMDQGEKGLQSTIRTCDKAGIGYLGAGNNFEEAKRIKFIECKNKRIALINCCENEWSTTFNKNPGANPLNEVELFYQIQEAKKNSQYIIIIIHGGHETYAFPSPRMKKLYRWFIDLGVDAVIGHHTHCYSGREIYKNKPIIYSLGNFVFDHSEWRDNFWTNGCACILNISSKGISTKIIPFHQCDSQVGIHKFDKKEMSEFRIFDQAKTEIIVNDKSLDAEYEKFLFSTQNMYNTFLEPTSNRFISILKRLHLIRSHLTPSKKMLYLNIIRCEAHRDALLHFLKYSSQVSLKKP